MSDFLCLVPASCWFLVFLSLRPWRWRRYAAPKARALSKLRRVTRNQQKQTESWDEPSKIWLSLVSWLVYISTMKMEAISPGLHCVRINQQNEAEIWVDRNKLAACFAGFVFGLQFYSEDGGDSFLRNVVLSLNHTGLQLGRPHALQCISWL
jgi:hypothetical protein